MEIREILPECFKDFNLIEEKDIRVCSNSHSCKPKGKEKDYINSFFAKSINVNVKIAHKNGLRLLFKIEK